MSSAPSSSTSGVHDARTSTWAVPGSSSIAPKLSVLTQVTVPDMEWWPAPWASRASVSQDQPTAWSIGSAPSSGSISARAYATQRKVPAQASLPAGSCSRISRPVPRSSSSTVTSPLRADDQGAMRWGAGISSQKTSGRSAARRIDSTAVRNSAGPAPAPAPGWVS